MLVGMEWSDNHVRVARGDRVQYSIIQYRYSAVAYSRSRIGKGLDGEGVEVFCGGDYADTEKYLHGKVHR